MCRCRELQRWPSVSLIAAGPERRAEHRAGGPVADDSSTIRSWKSRSSTTARPTGRGEILDRLAAEFPQLNVVHLTELPAGWLGKNHALQLGADRSHGEWLLFTDADIVFEPTALRRAIAYALANQRRSSGGDARCADAVVVPAVVRR